MPSVDDDDGVIHRAFFAQVCHGLGDGGRALADGAIDAHHILAALVEDGVDGDGGLAGLPIAQNQFALAAPDRNQRIDDFEAGLERHGDRRAIHDGSGGAFDRQALAGSHRPVAIERPAERIDDAAQQPVAHGHIHDAAGALDFVAGLQVPVIAEQHDADFVLVHVERDAEHIAGKLHQFLEADTGKAGDLGDAGGNAVIVPTSRGVSCGVKASRTWLIPAKVRSKTPCKAFGRGVHWFRCRNLASSGLAAAFAATSVWLRLRRQARVSASAGVGLSLFRSSSTPFSSDAR